MSTSMEFDAKVIFHNANTQPVPESEPRTIHYTTKLYGNVNDYGILIEVTTEANEPEFELGQTRHVTIS